MAPVSHRAGPFKQSNKKHKTGRHRTKGTLDVANKGRKSDVKSLTKAKHGLSKKDRRNRAKQMRNVQRTRVLSEKRRFGDATSPPFLTAVVSLCEDSSAEALLRLLSTCSSEAVVNYSPTGVVHVSVPRFKCRFSFCVPNASKICEILDILKVSDSLVLLWPHDGLLSEENTLLLNCIFASGLPTPINVVQGITTLTTKRKEQARRDILKALEKHSLDEGKLFTADSEADALMILRQISECKRKTLSVQRHRPYLLVESSTLVQQEEQTMLAVTGYVRGSPLNVNNLLHIPGWGDFQMDRIELVSDPNPLTTKRRAGDVTMDAEEETRLLERAEPTKRQPLQCEVVPDPMEGEQTWPTNDELLQAELFAAKKKPQRVPAGTSEYQAAWIVDDVENDEGADDDSGSEPDEDDDSMSEMEVTDDDEEETEQRTTADEMEASTAGSQVDSTDYGTVDLDEVEKFRKERENEQFPDEIDTPVDQPARIRFQKYRGLKSFRTSPWDPKENLPTDYARIFQFANYKQTRKRVLNQQIDGALHGWYVRIYICGLDTATVDALTAIPPRIIYGLLAHEQKMTVINLVLKKHPSYTHSVKSKEPLTFHLGCRRFIARPIFSQHTNGDKHKMERFMPSESAFVASLYAPMTFPPVSCLVFDGSGHVVATGRLLDMNPDRVVVKRIVLSGHPFKINKRSAIVRYMFFNREDVMWFKPVELRTNYGRRGHIKEPIGTHGHLKCVFDDQLSSQDTVLMNVYKRVFPKWHYIARIDANVEEDEMT